MKLQTSLVKFKIIYLKNKIYIIECIITTKY